MKSSIYEYRDYKSYFLDLIESDPTHRRGKRKDMAEAISCQVSHITNVLSGIGHFNQEQTESAARFFGLSFAETEFLLQLVQYNRAGTSSLKKFYEKVLYERQARVAGLKSKLSMPDSLKNYEESTYYSSWQYGAVHVLLSIPEYQNREAIVEKLGISMAKVDEILLFLIEAGLAKKEAHKFKIARSLLHLDKSSPLILRHHTNWRLRSLMALDENAEDQVHYSSVFTLSRKDYKRVREILTKALSDSMHVITESPEEDIAAVCLDLFKI